MKKKLLCFISVTYYGLPLMLWGAPSFSSAIPRADEVSESFSSPDEARQLNLATENKLLQIAKDRIAKNQIDVKDKNGCTILSLAAIRGYLKVVKLLLDKGAHIHLADKDKKTPLHLAAENGKTEVVRLLLSHNKRDVNTLDSWERTPLHWAARYGHMDIVILLIGDGANVNAKTHRNWTALQMAAEQGFPDVVQVLLTHGAEVNSNNDNDRTALHLAAQNGHLEATKILVEKGADVSLKNKDGWTPLHVASGNGHLEIMKFLIQAGGMILDQDDKGNTPFHLAAYFGKLDAVKLLLDDGALICNIPNKDGQTALHRAAEKGKTEVVRFLLSHNKSDVNTVDSWGRVPLHWAARYGHMDVAKLLIENGANVNEKTVKNWTPLHMAAEHGFPDVVHVLLSKGAEINSKNNNGRTALHMAAQNGHLEVAKILADNGAEINPENEDGWVPLHVASGNGHLDVMQFLIQAGGIMSRDYKGHTPLHLAAYFGKLDAVKLLVNRGADIAVKDNSGETPLDIALKRGIGDVAQFLKAPNATLDAVDEKGMTRLCRAAENGNLAEVKKLLDQNVKVNIPDNEGETPLHWAAKNGHTEVVKLLVPRIKVNARDQWNKTPLHWAARSGNPDVVKLLLNQGASVDAKTNDHLTPLHIATTHGQVEAVKELLTKNANPNIQNNNQNTPLHLAAQKGHLEIANQLVSKQAEIETRNKDGLSPLHLACGNKQRDMVQFLIKKKADIHATDHKGNTPLHLAAHVGDLNVVKILVAKKAILTVTNHNGKTPFDLAQKSKHQHIVEFLEVKPIGDISVDLVTKNAEGRTHLYLAVQNGDLDTIKSLATEENVNLKDCNGWSALQYAVKSKNLEMVSLLLSKGADFQSSIELAASIDISWDKLLSFAVSQKSKNVIRDFILHIERQKIDELLVSILGHSLPVNLHRSHHLQMTFDKKEEMQQFLEILSIFFDELPHGKVLNLTITVPYPFPLKTKTLNLDLYRERKTIFEKRIHKIAQLIDQENATIESIHFSEKIKEIVFSLKTNPLKLITIPAASFYEKEGNLFERLLIKEEKLLKKEEKERQNQEKSRTELIEKESEKKLAELLLRKEERTKQKILSHAYHVQSPDETELNLAISRFDTASIERILSTIDSKLLDTQNLNGDTALHVAAFSGNAWAFERLIDAHIDYSVQNMSGETAFDIARRENLPLGQDTLEVERAHSPEQEPLHDKDSEQELETMSGFHQDSLESDDRNPNDAIDVIRPETRKDKLEKKPSKKKEQSLKVYSPIGPKNLRDIHQKLTSSIHSDSYLSPYALTSHVISGLILIQYLLKQQPNCSQINNDLFHEITTIRNSLVHPYTEKFSMEELKYLARLVIDFKGSANKKNLQDFTKFRKIIENKKVYSHDLNFYKTKIAELTHDLKNAYDQLLKFLEKNIQAGSQVTEHLAFTANPDYPPAVTEMLCKFYEYNHKLLEESHSAPSMVHSLFNKLRKFRNKQYHETDQRLEEEQIEYAISPNNDGEILDLWKEICNLSSG